MNWQALIPSGDRILLLSFWVLVGIAVAAIVFWSVKRNTVFNLLDFITNEEGRGDPQKAAYTGSFLISSWLMWVLTAAGQMNEAYLGLYLGAYVAGRVLQKTAPPPSP